MLSLQHDPDVQTSALLNPNTALEELIKNLTKGKLHFTESNFRAHQLSSDDDLTSQSNSQRFQTAGVANKYPSQDVHCSLISNLIHENRYRYIHRQICQFFLNPIKS